MSIPEYAEIYYSNYDFVYMPNINIQIPKIPNYIITRIYISIPIITINTEIIRIVILALVISIIIPNNIILFRFRLYI